MKLLKSLTTVVDLACPRSAQTAQSQEGYLSVWEKQLGKLGRKSCRDGEKGIGLGLGFHNPKGIDNRELSSGRRPFTRLSKVS